MLEAATAAAAQQALEIETIVDVATKTPAIAAGSLVLDLGSVSHTWHAVSLDDDLGAGSISLDNVPTDDVVRIEVIFTQATPAGTVYDIEQTALSTLPGYVYLDSDWSIYQDATPSILVIRSVDGGTTWRVQTNAPLVAVGSGVDSQLILTEATNVDGGMTAVFTEYTEV
jgi:hypothetical protein